MIEARADRKLGLAVFALLLASYAYFYQGGGWNENSRMDLVRALVEDGSLGIDRFAANTGDKAQAFGHYYSDKAPGLSFLAAPLYALLRLARGLFASEHDFIVVACYVLTVLTVGVAGAATGALVYRAGRRLGASDSGAVLAALGYGLGTAAFPLSTMFFGHQLAALLLFLGFLLAWEAKTEDRPARSLAVAALLGAAVLVEFPTAPAALGLLAYHTGLRRPRRPWLWALVALVPLVALGAYLTLAFGSPLRVGYGLLADPAAREEMLSHGLFGVTYPHVPVLVELLLGRYRGLLPYSPVLFLAIPGFLGVLLPHDPDDGIPDVGAVNRRAVTVALGVVLYYLAFVSSYEWWQGGASFGSRHLSPMLPFFALPISLVASRRPGVAIALLVPSVAVMLIVTSVQPKPSDWVKDPLWGQLLPSFRQGALAITRSCPVYGTPMHPEHHPLFPAARWDAFNLGMALGGRGLRSLVPLLALWLTSAWALARGARAPRDQLS